MAGRLEVIFANFESFFGTLCQKKLSKLDSYLDYQPKLDSILFNTNRKFSGKIQKKCGGHFKKMSSWLRRVM